VNLLDNIKKSNYTAGYEKYEISKNIKRVETRGGGVG
jgi:hypothetical protein